MPPARRKGMLLYPCVGDSLDMRVTLFGRDTRVATLDLNQPWPGIHGQVVALLMG